MDYPLSNLVTQPSASSQKLFAEEVARAVHLQPEHSCFEVTDAGLRIRGITEIDLEIAFESVRQSFPSAQRGKPEVAYIFQPELTEPCYIATVHTPAQKAANVLADLSTRRGIVLSVKDLPEGRQIVVDLPVSEAFGYSTTLRALTEGRGSYTVTVGGYRKAGSSGLANDAV